MTPFEYVGHWWLPDEPDAKCTGTLWYDGVSRPELKLIGSLRPLLQAAIDGPFTPDIILGLSSDGQPITLHQCAETSYIHSQPGLSTVTYVSAYAILGGHFPDREMLRFQKFWIRYDRLLEWTQLTGFRWDVEGEKGVRQITVRWNEPRAFEVTIAGWMVRFTYGFNQSGDRLTHFNLEHRIALEVVPPEPKSIQGFLTEFAYHYRNFITLGLGTPVYSIDFRAQPVSEVNEPNKELEKQTS